MSKNLLNYLISKTNLPLRYQIRRLTSNKEIKEQNNKNLPQKTSGKKEAKSVTLKEIPVILDKYIKKARGEYDDSDEKKGDERKGPFKNYFEEDERNKKSIMFYEEYFEKNAKEKNRENFNTAVEAFSMINPTKQLYIDFIYGALLKMKDYDAHTNLESYRKLMEVFPIGPLRSQNLWQRDNFHFPRQQNCALAILEQMERNGVMLDEDMVALTIKVFGDWTHVVRKAKRQLYWLPKFKNANPYPLPSIGKMEKMSKLDLALAALERMCMSVDNGMKITAEYTNVLEEERDPTDESKWIVTAQSPSQIELLKAHKKDVPIFVEGPEYTWIRSKMVEYFVMRTDPLPETREKIQLIRNVNEDDVVNMPNAFDDPFKKQTQLVKIPQLSVHELVEGTVYAMCCTESSSKSSLYNWTKLLEKKIECLKDFAVVYKYKEKPKNIVDPSKINTEEGQQ